ncbi:hypothetical protein [Nonomuraea rubra]|uniref:hypothetical protein n=1 Tax=Nonomuraea rubra TaxID=46180 RepID=UPI0033DB5650
MSYNPRIDETRPHSARVWNYLLGGRTLDFSRPIRLIMLSIAGQVEAVAFCTPASSRRSTPGAAGCGVDAAVAAGAAAAGPGGGECDVWGGP